RAARVVVAFDADFLVSGPNAVRHAHDFMEGRRPGATPGTMNRLYVVETTLTGTGTRADHRLRCRPSEMPLAVLSLLEALREHSSHDGASPSLPDASAPERLRHWAPAVAADVLANRSASLVLAGDGQPPVVHALVHAVNELLGNHGTTVTFT